MPYADVNGQRLYYEDARGGGLPVILAHGFFMDHEMFAPQVDALGRDFRLITWDQRGHGRTEFDGRPFTYWDSARDCLGLLDHLGVESAVVGGISQGGYLSLRAALLAPQRVLGLVLIDTQAGVDDPETKAGYERMFQQWVDEGPVDDLVERLASLIVNDPEENARWVAKWRARGKETRMVEQPARCLLEREDITDRLREIHCPAIVLHGTADPAIGMDRARELCEGLPDCRGVVPVEGAAHASNLTHPEPVNAALKEFLRGL